MAVAFDFGFHFVAAVRRLLLPLVATRRRWWVSETLACRPLVTTWRWW